MSLERICNEVLNDIKTLVRNNIANEEMSFVTKDNYDEAFKQEVARYRNPKVHLAKRWLSITAFVFLILNECLKQENANYYFVLQMGLLLVMFECTYEKRFINPPLESIGTQLLLDKKEAHFIDCTSRNTISFKQAESLSFPGFFQKTFLDSAFLKDMDYQEFNAMWRGLLSLKNNAFDCVSISVLVILSLIEKELPCIIQRARALPGNLSHFYTMVNLSESSDFQQVSTWNDDAILLDPWYRISITAKALKADKDFFENYPLLDPKNKKLSKAIYANNPPPGYLLAMEKFQILREEYQSGKIKPSSHVEILFPSMGFSK